MQILFIQYSEDIEICEKLIITFYAYMYSDRNNQ